jgi:hypothetical protein
VPKHPGRLPAVDEQVGAVDVPRLGAGEEGHGVGDLAGRARPARAARVA